MAGFSIDMKIVGARALGTRLARAPAKLRRRQVLALKRAAVFAVGAIKLGIRSGRPGGKRLRPLSLSTRITRKHGGRKPLLDSTALWNSITHKVDERKLQAFVGVLRTAKSADGQSLVNVALIHEKGTRPYTIRVTDRLRAFFWWLHFASGGRINPISSSKTVIHHPGVPARPFIAPTVEKIRPKLQKIIAKAYSERGGPI